MSVNFCALALCDRGHAVPGKRREFADDFLSLELTSLSLCAVRFNKRSIASAEASLKYFLFGGMSAAFTLFGLSLIYGLAVRFISRPSQQFARATNDTLFLAGWL
jgi:NADH:ubiquinone oxidoreductase subunit 2 (subunit N)